VNRLEITRHTTDAAITRFCEENPQYSRKVVMAQARHERRVKRIEHRKQWDIGKSNASVNEYWQRVGGHPPPEQQDQ
jgi:hypothetical protein